MNFVYLGSKNEKCPLILPEKNQYLLTKVPRNSVDYSDIIKILINGRLLKKLLDDFEC